MGVLKIGPQLTISDGINSVGNGSFGDSIKEQYPQCFKGIGKLKDRQLKIRLKLARFHMDYSLSSKLNWMNWNYRKGGRASKMG